MKLEAVWLGQIECWVEDFSSTEEVITFCFTDSSISLASQTFAFYVRRSGSRDYSSIGSNSQGLAFEQLHRLKVDLSLLMLSLLSHWKRQMQRNRVGRAWKSVGLLIRVSNRKYESMQNQSTAVFPSRSTIGKIETIPQMEMTLKMFAPNAILNQQC